MSRDSGAEPVDTPSGPASLELRAPAGPRALALLGHGAGGGVHVPDLLAVTAAANRLGVAVGLVQQPYRVAGRRAPAPAARLDAAWLAVAAAARDRLGPLPLFCGGRSSGARVACRTAAELDVAGVICLAFPLHPPGRTEPDKSRLPELEAIPASAAVLIIQGERDPFGLPPAAEGREVVTIPGTHRLTATAAIETIVTDWLAPRLAD